MLRSHSPCVSVIRDGRQSTTKGRRRSHSRRMAPEYARSGRDDEHCWGAKPLLLAREDKVIVANLKMAGAAKADRRFRVSLRWNLALLETPRRDLDLSVSLSSNIDQPAQD